MMQNKIRRKSREVEGEGSYCSLGVFKYPMGSSLRLFHLNLTKIHSGTHCHPPVIERKRGTQKQSNLSKVTQSGPTGVGFKGGCPDPQYWTILFDRGVSRMRKDSMDGK